MEDAQKASVMVAPPQPEEEKQEPLPVLGRDAFLAADDLKVVLVDVPESKGAIYVRVMTGKARDDFEQRVQDANKNGKLDVRGIRVRLVIDTACDEGGAALFTDADADALNAKSSAALDKIVKAAQRLNGLTDEDVEDLAKN